MGEVRSRRVKTLWVSSVIIVLVIAGLATFWGYNVSTTLTNLKGNIDNINNKLNNLNNKMDKISSNLTKSLTEKAKMMAREESARVLKQLKPRVDELSKHYGNLSAEVSEIRSRYQADLEQLGSEVSSLKAKISSLENSLNKKVSAFEERLTELNKELKALNETLSKYKEALIKINFLTSKSLSTLTKVGELIGGVTDSRTRNALISLYNVTYGLLKDVNETISVTLGKTRSPRLSYRVDQVVNAGGNLTDALIKLEYINLGLKNTRLSNEMLKSILRGLGEVEENLKNVGYSLGL